MKLPINPLLHLISLAAVGGMVMSGLQLSKNTDIYDARRGTINKDIKKLRNAKGGAIDSGKWDYRDTPFWTGFTEANFTGKVKVVAKAKNPDDEQPKKAAPGMIQLSDILHVIAISHGNGISGAVVNYTANVEVPTKYQISPSNSVLGSIPRGRQRKVKEQIPVRQTASSPPHHLRIGDPLWPPYEHVALHAIFTDASAVEFELRLEGKDNVVQELRKNVLGLPEDVLDVFDKSAGKAAAKLAKSGSKPASKDSSAGYNWVDQPSTFVDRRGNVNISNKDSKWLGRSGGQIFNEDVHMRDYSSGTGNRKVRGIQLRKLSARVRKFGAQEGDVVLSINNEPVKGMAQAKRLGRRLYNRGVRSFRIEVLRRGERQILRYHMKKDK